MNQGAPIDSSLAARIDGVRGVAALRDSLLASVLDEDLRRVLGGSAPTLGHVLADHAEVVADYVATLRVDGQRPETVRGTTVHVLRAQYAALDAAFEAAVEMLEPEQWATSVMRPDGEVRSRAEQIEILAQAGLIVLARATVYLRAFGRGLPPAVLRYLG